MGLVETTAARIRSLEIQGANAIAKAAVEALAGELAVEPRADRRALAELLAGARPNEPMLRNLLELFLSSVEEEDVSGEPGERAGALLEQVRRDEEALARVGADLFLFGADAVLPSGYLINKVGTGIFCVVASRYDVPTYCATLTLKVVRDHIDEAVEQRDPAEVWPDAPAGVLVLNPAFDKVHLKYVTAFITERGLVKDVLTLCPPAPPARGRL